MKTSRSVQQYLTNAKDSANQRFANFNGSRGQNNYANFTGNERYFNADAAQQAPPVPSRPYGITISNSTAQAVTNFVIFGAFTYANSSNFSGGTYTASGVSVSGAIAGVTYQYLLQQSNVNPFTIGSTAIVSITNASQITQPINVATTDASGLSVTVPIIFILDPYQQQTGTIVNNTSYRVDGSTTLTMNIQPSAVFTLYLYPSTTVSPSRDLLGNAPAANYSAPGIIRTNTTVIPSAAAVVNRIGQ